MAMLAQSLSLERGSTGHDSTRYLRDPSFSYYLSGTEDCYTINLAKKSLEAGEMEIDVFSAEKYFNESLDDEKPDLMKLPRSQDLVSSSAKIKGLSGALSVGSSSSWNSQGALLQQEHKNSSVKSQSYLGSFRCRCVCTDKNSVEVDEYQICGEVLHPVQNAEKEPMKQVVQPINAEGQCMANDRLKKETSLSSEDISILNLAMKPRKSMEVFGAPLVHMERKLTLNRKDSLRLSIPGKTTIPIVTDGPYAGSDSDSSSDLFEICDFTSKESPFRSRNLSDSTMSMAYAPSEASIDWSVVTASAAEFPITSDYDELRPHKNKTSSKTVSKGMNQKITAASDKPRRLPGSFFACNNQNSVSVVNHAQTMNEKKATIIHKSQDFPKQVYSAQMEAKRTRLEKARDMHVGISSKSLGQSKSLTRF